MKSLYVPHSHTPPSLRMTRPVLSPDFLDLEGCSEGAARPLELTCRREDLLGLPSVTFFNTFLDPSGNVRDPIFDLGVLAFQVLGVVRFLLFHRGCIQSGRLASVEGTDDQAVGHQESTAYHLLVHAMQGEVGLGNWFKEEWDIWATC